MRFQNGSNNRPRSIYQYSSMAPRLSGQNCKIFKQFFCPSIPKRGLEIKKTTPNLEVWPESLGAMLEYIDISNMAYWTSGRAILVWNHTCDLKSNSRCVLVGFWNNAYDFRPNWTPLSSVTIINWSPDCPRPKLKVIWLFKLQDVNVLENSCFFFQTFKSPWHMCSWYTL